MSRRRSRKRRAAGSAVKLWTTRKAAKGAGKAAGAIVSAKVGKAAARRAPSRRVTAVIAGAIGIAALAAVIRRRQARKADLPYGPPNESVPSHETLAPSREAAAKEPAPEPAAKEPAPDVNGGAPDAEEAGRKA